MRESKDKIKSRMIRNAAQIWGFQEPQSENSFDPLVSLLLGACAFELEKISSEINNSESRIIERMVNILTPQPITSPHPAYAIAYAKPYKQPAKVMPDNQFFTNIKVSDVYGKKMEDKQIFFSPTGTFSLTDGRVRYIAAHKRIYEIVDDSYKDVITEKFKTSIPPSSIFIGLEMNESPSDITFFFDVVNEHLKQSFLTGLELCQWKINGILLDTQKGIVNLNRQDHNFQERINRQYDLASKIGHHVNKYFNRQFVTLQWKGATGFLESNNLKIPEALLYSLDEKELSRINENIVWIELQFNMPIAEDLPENLTCSLNCFPVINRRQNEYTGSIRELINIIPLHTEDVFFDLKRVTNSNGDAYKINHFVSQNDIPKGTALLRSEGVGRFDSRTAMEYLEYLLELMKEESAAFNVIDSDLIASNLRELNQAIARLEKKMEDVQLQTGDTTYLMLKPQDGDRQVFVEFWSTNCTMANNIRSGSILNVYQADDIDYNASRLMTTTTGGKDKPNTETRIHIYRRALQSGDRVVTIEDIKALCFESIGNSISQVRVEKGTEISSCKSEGFIRTIDIFISIKNGHELSVAEQNAIRQELKVLLEERSSNSFPFRIFINQG